MKSLFARVAFSFGLTALGLLGCQGPTLIVQQYAGPVRPTETVAVLRLNGADSVRLATLDDEDIAVPIAPDTRLHIEMLPGRHRVSASRAGDRYGRALVLPFDAEAGHVYRVVLGAVDADRGDFTARLMEVDRDTDAPLRDVTRETPRARREAPAPATATTTTTTPTRDADAGPAGTMCVDPGPGAGDGGAPCEAGAPRL